MAGGSDRVLVVDGDVAGRDLLIRALAGEGFSCDGASGGAEALARAGRTRYDVVVTQLRLAGGQGHALASRLLDLADPPLVLVAAGVREVGVAKELLLRGVEDILMKPFDTRLAAAKIRAMADRRKSRAAGREERPGPRPPPADRQEAGPTERISLAELEDRLQRGGEHSPFSPTALVVFHMAISGRFSARQLAEAVQRDVSLAFQVVQTATTGFCNPTGRRIVELEEAVVRVGQKRLGELALATSLLAAPDLPSVPGMDLSLALRRSFAAGLAVELVVFEGGHKAIDAGLYLSALAHLSGRMALARLFPGRYAAMVQRCLDRQETLVSQERRVFPWSHPEVMAYLLAEARIPPPFAAPLRHLEDGWASLAKLEGPARKRAEILKLAVLAGHIAAGGWEPWDVIEFPSVAVLRRIHLESVSTIVEDTRARLATLARYSGTGGGPCPGLAPVGPRPAARRLAYLRLSPTPFDFLAAVVPSMGIRLDPVPPAQAGGGGPVLVNAVDGTPEQLEARAAALEGSKATILGDAGQVEAFRKWGAVVALPASYGAVHQILWQAAEKLGDDRPGQTAVPISCDLLA